MAESLDELLEDVRGHELAWRWIAEDLARELGVPSSRLIPVAQALVELAGLPLPIGIRSNYRARIFADLYGRNARAPRRGYATQRQPLTTIALEG
ncbi:MAG: hypothetical protein WAL84_07575 [Candidatus Dormiibacterota bacterium]